MKVVIRFFARFGELLGKSITVDVPPGTSLATLVKDATGSNKEGYEAIFDDNGEFRGFVILTIKGKRVRAADAKTTSVSDGDEVAVFPPVAGG